VNGIHDVGGMHGFGAVRKEADEPVFHTRWEGRLFALVNLCLGVGIGNIDRFRHAIERLSPASYLTESYYGRWLAALETLLEEEGVVRRSETDARERGEGPPAAMAPAPSPTSGAARRRVDTPPRFAVGQPVRARNLNPPGHTRLPRYARGKCGVIVRVHPAWVFPDTNAQGRGENPQYAYGVRFGAEELWGPEAEPGTAMHLDLFESYLEPVSDEG